MTDPDIIEWFDAHWMIARDGALHLGWDNLSRPDQVLVAVGFLLDSCIGGGVTMIVDGMLDGSDERMTARMPAALDEVGLPEAAEHIRQIVRLRTPSDSASADAANRQAALAHWQAIHLLFDEWEVDGERVMVARLYEWYHAQTSNP